MRFPASAPAGAKQLLIAFGSVNGVRRATREELTRVVGAKTANAVIEYFTNVG